MDREVDKADLAGLATAARAVMVCHQGPARLHTHLSLATKCDAHFCGPVGSVRQVRRELAGYRVVDCGCRHNRDGSAFDVGETFSGVDFTTGVEASRTFAELVRQEAPTGTTSAQAAIAWLCQQPEVSTVIPGARTVQQAQANAAAASVPALGPSFTQGVMAIYDSRLREAVHSRW